MAHAPFSPTLVYSCPICMAPHCVPLMAPDCVPLGLPSLEKPAAKDSLHGL